MGKRLPVSILLALFVLVALLVPESLAGKKKKKKKPTPPITVVVGTDDVGDWGSGVNSGLNPIGDELGQDLVEATITMADAATLNFIIKVNSLPPTGGVPEISRYNWDLTVDGVAFQLTGGFTEYLRGVCNPLHTDYCPPPRDPGMSPFFVRQGPCTVGADCFVLAIANATFDAAAGTITIPVPLEVFKATVGSTIGPGASTFGPPIYAVPALFVSSPNAPSDTMEVPTSYVIPEVPAG